MKNALNNKCIYQTGLNMSFQIAKLRKKFKKQNFSQYIFGKSI